jgi:hypothetical protein
MEQDAVTPLSEREAVDLVKDVFASATERDIYTVIFLSFIISSFLLSLLYALLKKKVLN